MNGSESTNTFKPRQAFAPTPQLYDELVGDAMKDLAKATITEIPPIGPGSVILDAGCGTGAGTAAIIESLGPGVAAHISIKGTDIDKNALSVYEARANEKSWPVEAVQADSGKLDIFSDATFTHALNNISLHFLPDDGVPAVREMYRTLKPGGFAMFNSWASIPNMAPLRAANRQTRPEGSPDIRGGTDKWEDGDFLKSVIEQGGFSRDKISIVQRDVYVTAVPVDRYVRLLWSFIGGTTSVGWLESDEERWDEALDIIKVELSKTEGYQELEDGRLRLKFVANIATATR